MGDREGGWGGHRRTIVEADYSMAVIVVKM